MSKSLPSTRKRVRPRPGDVVAIPLSSGRYGFGRIYENCGLGVFRFTAKELPEVTTVLARPNEFHCYFFTTRVKSGAWPIIGHAPFRNKAAASPPPMWHLDEISGRYEIRRNDRSVPATKAQIQGLDEEVMWYPEGLVAEIERRLRRHYTGPATNRRAGASMDSHRNYRKLYRLLHRLYELRASDPDAEEFPQQVSKPGKMPEAVPTLVKGKTQPLTPMLAARFAFAGQWKEVSLGITWLSAAGMKQGYSQASTKAQLEARRQYWEGSILAKHDASHVSLFGIDPVEAAEVYLVWGQTGREPKVVWYTSQHDYHFANLAKYVAFLLGE